MFRKWENSSEETFGDKLQVELATSNFRQEQKNLTEGL